MRTDARLSSESLPVSRAFRLPRAESAYSIGTDIERCGGGTPASSAAMRMTSFNAIIRSETRYRSPMRPRSAARIMARAASSTPTTSSWMPFIPKGSLPNTAPAMKAPCGVPPQSPLP